MRRTSGLLAAIAGILVLLITWWARVNRDGTGDHEKRVVSPIGTVLSRKAESCNVAPSAPVRASPSSAIYGHVTLAHAIFVRADGFAASYSGDVAVLPARTNRASVRFTATPLTPPRGLQWGAADQNGE